MHPQASTLLVARNSSRSKTPGALTCGMKLLYQDRGSMAIGVWEMVIERKLIPPCKISNYLEYFLNARHTKISRNVTGSV